MEMSTTLRFGQLKNDGDCSLPRNGLIKKMNNASMFTTNVYNFMFSGIS